MATLKDLSKQTFNGNTNIDHINAGSLQRIADATEAMAKNHIQMQTSLDWYKAQYKSLSERNSQKDRTISALKGEITKLKKKLNNPQPNNNE